MADAGPRIARDRLATRKYNVSTRHLCGLLTLLLSSSFFPPSLFLLISFSAYTHPSIAFTMPPDVLTKYFFYDTRRDTRGRGEGGDGCKVQMASGNAPSAPGNSFSTARALYTSSFNARKCAFLYIARGYRYIPFYAVLYTVYVYPTYLRRRRRRRLLRANLIVYWFILRYSVSGASTITANLVTI